MLTTEDHPSTHVIRGSPWTSHVRLRRFSGDLIGIADYPRRFQWVRALPTGVRGDSHGQSWNTMGIVYDCRGFRWIPTVCTEIRGKSRNISWKSISSCRIHAVRTGVRRDTHSITWERLEICAILPSDPTYRYLFRGGAWKCCRDLLAIADCLNGLS